MTEALRFRAWRELGKLRSETHQHVCWGYYLYFIKFTKLDWKCRMEKCNEILQMRPKNRNMAPSPSLHCFSCVYSLQAIIDNTSNSGLILHFKGPADDEGEQPSSQTLTPLDASTSSVSSSLCSMCLSKGFPSRRNSWKRESSSWAGPADDAACLLGETDGERHWPINLNSWIDGGEPWTRERRPEWKLYRKHREQVNNTDRRSQGHNCKPTAYYIIFVYAS